MPKIIKYFQEKVVFLPVPLPPQNEFNFEVDFEEVCV